MGNFLSAKSEKIFSNPSKPGYAQCDINQISYARRNLKLSWGQWTKSIHQADECWWCGKISWITRAERGGSLWNYFFYSLLLGDNINWGGGSSILGIKGLLWWGTFYTKNGTQWIKTEPIHRNCVLPHKVVSIDLHLFIFLPTWVSPTWMKIRDVKAGKNEPVSGNIMRWNAFTNGWWSWTRHWDMSLMRFVHSSCVGSLNLHST